MNKIFEFLIIYIDKTTSKDKIVDRSGVKTTARLRRRVHMENITEKLEALMKLLDLPQRIKVKITAIEGCDDFRYYLIEVRIKDWGTVVMHYDSYDINALKLTTNGNMIQVKDWKMVGMIAEAIEKREWEHAKRSYETLRVMDQLKEFDSAITYNEEVAELYMKGTANNFKVEKTEANNDDVFWTITKREGAK